MMAENTVQSMVKAMKIRVVNSHTGERVVKVLTCNWS